MADGDQIPLPIAIEVGPFDLAGTISPRNGHRLAHKSPIFTPQKDRQIPRITVGGEQVQVSVPVPVESGQGEGTRSGWIIHSGRKGKKRDIRIGMGRIDLPCRDCDQGKTAP